MADIDLKITVDDDDVIRSLDKVERNITDLAKEADKAGDVISTSFKKAGDAVDDFGKDAAAAGNKVTNATDKASKSSENLASKIRNFRRESGLVLAGLAGAFLGAASSIDQLLNRFVPLLAIQKRVADASQDAVLNFVQERRQLEQLTQAATDETRSAREREQAKQAIIEQYKEYLPSIESDIEKTGLLATVNNKLKDAIRARTVEQAKSAIQEKLIADLGVKILEARQKEIAAIQAGAINGVFSAFQRGQGLIAQFESAAIKTQLGLIETVGKDLDAALSELDGLGVFKDTIKLTGDEVAGLAPKAKTTKDELKPLVGSLADLEAQLKKVNDQIQQQTVAGDTSALKPLIEQAQTLARQIKAANDEIDRLKNPPQAELPVVSTINAVTKSFEDLQSELQTNSDLLTARLEAQQQGELLRLKQSKATEEEITAAQAEQEKERQKLALQTEQKRLEFLLQYGDIRTEAEKETLQQQLSAIGSQLAAFETQATKTIEGESGRRSFFELLGIDPNTEEGAKAIDGIKQGFQIAIDNFSQLAAAQVEFAERAVQKRDENISRLQSQLDQELRLNEQGFANNTKAVQKQLNEERKAREKALADQKKAKQEQLILETISQAANLVSASAQIFNSFAGLPFGIGIPIAAGVVAAMVGSFIALKVKAFQAVQQNFAEGGELPTITEGGRTDKYGGRGHRIEDTNIFVGGGEFVTKAEVTKEHSDFLHNLNDGEYSGLDLVKIIDNRGRMINKMMNNQVIILQQKERDYQSAMERAIANTVQKQLSIIIKKPSIIPTENGYIESKTDEKGNTNIIKINTPNGKN